MTDVDLRRISFSVIVPTRRRPAQLGKCLHALATQDYPHRAYEVIVVHDGEPAWKNEAVRSNTDLAGASLRFVTQPHGGPAMARNTGAHCATGSVLVFTDDDCAPAPDWLTQLERHVHRSPGSAIGGLTINALATVIYSSASQLLIDYLYDYYHVAQTGARFFTTNNFAVPARAFRELKGFDLSFPRAGGEDREFCERWQRSGRQIVYAEDVQVHHAHRLNLRGFIRQHFNYGRGADLLHRSRARQTGHDRLPKLEPAGFYLNLVRFPFTRRLAWRAYPLAALMFLSQAAYGIGYLTERLRRGRRSRVRLRTEIATPQTDRQRQI